MSDQRGKYWVVERAGSIAGHPDGPIPVQPGDIVIVHVVKSWAGLGLAAQNASTLLEVKAK